MQLYSRGVIVSEVFVAHVKNEVSNHLKICLFIQIVTD